MMQGGGMYFSIANCNSILGMRCPQKGSNKKHVKEIVIYTPLEISVPRMKIVFMYAGLMLPRDSDEEIAL
jgi:hypothetical protein